MEFMLNYHKLIHKRLHLLKNSKFILEKETILFLSKDLSKDAFGGKSPTIQIRKVLIFIGAKVR